MATNIGTVIEGKYEILKLIGTGGMSYVYLAMDKRLNKQWAVKEIKKTANGKNDEIIENSLLTEANLMKKLDHPALPRIVDIIFDVQAKYNIDLPITFLGQKIKLSTMSSYDSVPVSDSAEFINNINMAKNYVESNKKIQEAIQKVKDFLK